MKLVGEGVSSCVIHPPYSCDSMKRMNGNMVGKIMKPSKAKEEEDRYSIIHSLDPKRIFSPKKVFRCKIGEQTPEILSKLKSLRCKTFQDRPVNNLEQIVMTHHGIPMYKFSFDRFTGQKYLLREAKRLLYCGSLLRKHKLSHMDLHSGNILVDPSNGKCTVIDFGELTRDKDVYGYIQKRVFTKKDYVQFPPELILLSMIVSDSNREEIGSILHALQPKDVELLKRGAKSGTYASVLMGELSRRSKHHKILIDYLDPGSFPEISRDNLYSLRCKAVLSLYTILRSGKSFAYACALSFVTIDSYAIGLLLLSLCQKIVGQNSKIVGTTVFRAVQELGRGLTKSDIQNRITCREGLDSLIDLSK
jgi:serine/threonine protein kinase